MSKKTVKKFGKALALTLKDIRVIVLETLAVLFIIYLFLLPIIKGFLGKIFAILGMCFALITSLLFGG
ncbi:MAG: hypothetical protein AAB590_03395 [Patescibacteria group bacterium]